MDGRITERAASLNPRTVAVAWLCLAATAGCRGPGTGVTDGAEPPVGPAPVVLAADDMAGLEKQLPVDLPAIVEFMKPTCAACRAIEPYVRALASKYGRRVQVFQVDAAESPALVEEYRVGVTPTFLGFARGGKLVGKEVATAEKDVKALFDRWADPAGGVAPIPLSAPDTPSFLKLLPADSIAVIEFMDPHCAACTALKPVFLELTRQYAGKLRVYQVDISKSRELAAEYGISFTPTFLAFDPGPKPKARELVGSEQHLKAMFELWAQPPEEPTPEP